MCGPDWLEQGMKHVWLPYSQMRTALPPLPAASTRGCTITLADGTELVDGIASWWTACHGYNHPHIRAAVAAQLERMPHVMFGGLVNEPALTLATRLASMLPGDLDRVFFTDSGSVAVEVAMKMAIQYWLNRGQAGRTRLVAFRGGYHGDTMATMAVCDPEEGMHSLYQAHCRNISLPTCRSMTRARRRLIPCWASRVSVSPPLSSNHWCRARAACCFIPPMSCAGCARLRTGTACC